MYVMDCGRLERDTELNDDSAMSHDDHSDRENDIRDCESSDEGDGSHTKVNGTSLDYGGRLPDSNVDLSLNHHSQFGANHSLGVIGNFMGVPCLQSLPSLQHGDVLEKLKMQVRDMKVGLMDSEYPTHSTFSPTIASQVSSSFSMPQPLVNGSSASQNLLNKHQNMTQGQHPHSQTNGFLFTPPNAPNTKDANPGSNSSTSSETSNSSQQNNGWSFEEQYKQVRQLYEISDDPDRKKFLDSLFLFMHERGTPINRLPIMAKSVLDLYELFNLVVARGGLVDVINKKLWQEIIKGLHLPSSITSAAFTLRTQYMKYLYPYECEKLKLSKPEDLQAAIEGNRREGRRSSYGHLDALQSQIQMSQIQRQPVPNGLQQMSPLALVTRGNTSSPHHRLMPPPLNQIPNFVSQVEQERFYDYVKLLQQSAKAQPQDVITAIERSYALFSMYGKNNPSPPESLNTKLGISEPQREALNLSESPPSIGIKRELERTESATCSQWYNDIYQPPPAKRATPADFSGNNSADEDETHTNSISERHPVQCGEKSTSLALENNEFSALTGMQFKISRKGTGNNGSQQLVVNLDLNGVHYEGILFANPRSRSSSAASNSKTSNSDNEPPLEERQHTLLS